MEGRLIMDSAKIIGIIGGGNMGGGIARGIVNAGVVNPENIIVSDTNPETLGKLQKSCGVCTTTDNKKLCEQADIIFLAVKPFLLADVIANVRDYVNADALVVSVAAGQTIERVERLFGRELHLVRIMPNLGAVVGESMTGYTLNSNVTAEDREDLVELLSSFGLCEEIAENLMDVITAVSGSAPAYIATMIDAMADAAVLNGMPRAKAYKICEQAMLGTAKYLLETGVTPCALKDMVCTPGGTSIEAVTVMEREGIRGAIHAGVTACTEKSRSL